MERFKKLGVLGAVAVAGLMLGSAIGYAVPEVGWITAWVGKGSRRNTTEFSITSGSSIGPANFVPGTTNTNALGTSSLRFSNVFTTLLNVSGASTLTGDVTMSGALTASGANISVQKSTAPRTSSTLVYGSTGTLVYNTTDGYLCISTGSLQSSFVLVSSTFTACAH